MFVHVYERACRCPGLSGVYLATDDERIVQAAKAHAVPVIRTSPEHHSGTDRVMEAAEHIGLEDSDVVLNIQGDEPALAPQMLAELMEPLRDETVQTATLARSIDRKEAGSPHVVKVVLDGRNRALYFSRAVIPHHAEQSRSTDLFWGHVGMYGFRVEALKAFTRLGPGRLERIEKLEQLRFLEAGLPMHVAATAWKSHGVDRPEDVPLVEHLLQQEQP
jgi:3-deoxy-manno-octulosonate cytidylyltransferase (CMP-KDO synthetase)